MKLINEDTITAVATPPGIGGIAVIRVSGSNSIPALIKIFKTKNDAKEFPSHTIHYGEIVSPSGELIDDVLVSVFRNPHSYTGEDCVEISTHGNPIITHKIIGLLLTDNIRTAEPGEFTKRAFLNGKMDLTQAEAVADLINARTEASLTGARNQLTGYLSLKINSIRDLLVNIFSMLELELDFAEEDIKFLSKQDIINQIENIITEITGLIRSYSFGKIIRDGVNVALVGKPNVGKSSLLNHLLQESRAIVSEIPGTTRDVIREEIEYSGILFRLHDTAGIRATEDVIEKEGVERSREVVSKANLVLLIDDPETIRSTDLEEELQHLTKKEKIINILNKIDLISYIPAQYDLHVSAKTGRGIDKLLQLLKQKALGHSHYSEKTEFITNSRHYENLKRAKKSLQNVLDSIRKNYSEEFISMDLRYAEQNLAEIIGKVTNDDILNNIFSKFCIGK